MKKRLLIIILALATVVPVFSQTTLCENFDDCAADNSTQAYKDSSYEQAFGWNRYIAPGRCLQNWEVASGTPSLYDNTHPWGPAYNGSRFAAIAACGDNFPNQLSEGLVLKYNFTPGNTYTVSMAVKTAGGVALNVEYWLLQNSLNYPYNFNTGCSATPPVPMGSLKVDSIVNFNATGWQIVSFTISNLQNNFSRLWIMPVEIQSTTEFLLLDHLCITMNNPDNFCESFDGCVVDNSTQAYRDSSYEQAFGWNRYIAPGRCLQNWEVASGTPSLYDNTHPWGPAYNGSRFAAIAACGDNFPNQLSESLVLKYDFAPAFDYVVSMALKTSGSVPLKVKYILLADSIHYPYNFRTGCSASPSIPGTGWEVDSIDNFTSDTGWHVRSFHIFNPQGSYSRLWILPVELQNTTNFLLLDSICIQALEIVSLPTPQAGEWQVELYPNPSSELLNVKMSGEIHSLIQYNILSIDGRLISAGSTWQKQFRLGTAELPDGVYLLHLKRNGLADVVKRFEVLH